MNQKKVRQLGKLARLEKTKPKIIFSEYSNCKKRIIGEIKRRGIK